LRLAKLGAELFDVLMHLPKVRRLLASELAKGGDDHRCVGAEATHQSKRALCGFELAVRVIEKQTLQVRAGGIKPLRAGGLKEVEHREAGMKLVLGFRRVKRVRVVVRVVGTDWCASWGRGHDYDSMMTFALSRRTSWGPRRGDRRGARRGDRRGARRGDRRGARRGDWCASWGRGHDYDSMMTFALSRRTSWKRPHPIARPPESERSACVIIKS
ncbi:MAG: hypothetical protein ACI9KE_002491, partial [Polyangiales bacterium]